MGTATMDRPIATTLDQVPAELERELNRFVTMEAYLLDQHKLEEWNALFTPDGHYWIPLIHGQDDPLNHASIAYEDAILRDVRIRRLRERRAWSQQPITHATRMLGAPLVLDRAEGDDRIVVTTAFQMVEWRKRREQRLIAGRYTHTLVRMDGALRMELKRVDLVNCDGIHDNFELFV